MGFSRSFIWLVTAVSLVSCAPPYGSKLVKECVLPSDQRGTLAGKWNVTPVPIAFRTGNFSVNEMASILEAADTWNNFYGRSLGIQVIDYGSRSSPRQLALSRSSSLCQDGPIVSGGTFSRPVMIYKHSTWPHGSSNSNAVAMTSFCLGSGSPLREINTAMIDLNYQNFFVPGKKVPDLTSILVHEFGHLLGVDHSCEGSRSGFPNCSSPSLPVAYLEAVMHPVVPFDTSGYGVPKRTLMSNDMGRGNCLYMD